MQNDPEIPVRAGDKSIAFYYLKFFYLGDAPHNNAEIIALISREAFFTAATREKE